MDRHQNLEERSPISPATPVAHKPSSSSSMASLPSKPLSVQRHIITEYNDAFYNPGAIPRVPLRVPRKNPRRSLPPMGFPHQASYGPSSPASTVTSPGHMSLAYKADSTGDLERDEDISAPEAVESDEKHWFAHRKRSRRFLVIVGVVTLVIIVVLAIGLPVGLRNKVSTQGSQADDGDDPSGMPFPAGAFSFKTSLQKTDAGCTSKNTTWKCDPMRPGEPTTFYWDITQVNYYTYTITSNKNPFAPDFNNVSMKIRDYNKPTERLEFAFSMNKTVTPSDSGSPTNRAAKCMYVDTLFQASMYTRKRGTTLFSTLKHHAKYSSWPGDFEIVQSLDSTIGKPMCTDASNNLIADVGAGPGTCRCQYTNAKSQP
ncbi:hypothetical protein QQS21_003213 [Conoideocrella luteorostrata]|uniref:Tat pathway signal sequence n=1 Tax=Conoideocrella luteorostrata TaxID=1105319 RepID=A0AAJ0G0S7_9HYPO|nr:hypothetical protein QQS21_003213 [Conoideocrella luteorostrata]